MTIATLDQYIASAKQMVPYCKTGARTTAANTWYSLFDVAGNPGAGVLAGTNATTGIVPDDTIAGFPSLNTFGGSAGYITNVDFGNTVACRLTLFDCLWKGGTYAFNAAVSAQTPTSFSARVPGANYNGLQIWVETVTAATGSQTFNVTYNNQAGTTGRTTGAVGTGGAPKLGQMWQLPLQSGDSGVQGITGVTGATGTVGTYNILVMRPLWSGRVRVANDGDVHALDKTGMPLVYATSALFLAINTDSTASGVPELQIEVANA
jgi:hypothetical protein